MACNKETSFENEICFLQKECDLLIEKILIVEENFKEVDQNDGDQLYEINEKVIDLLGLVNAYLIRFNKFMDVVNKNNNNNQ